MLSSAAAASSLRPAKAAARHGAEYAGAYGFLLVLLAVAEVAPQHLA